MIVRFGKSGAGIIEEIFPRFDALCPPNFVLHSIVRNRILSPGVGKRETERKKEKYNGNGERDRGNQRGVQLKKGGK